MRLTLLGISLGLAAFAPLHGQRPDPLFVGLSSGYTVLPSDLPAAYLAAVSGRADVQGSADPKDAIGLSVRAGVGVTNDVALAGVIGFAATRVGMDLASTRTSVNLNVLTAGLDAFVSPWRAVYLIGGLGLWTLDPEGADAHTSLSWTPGIGHREGAFRFELRDRMTVKTLAPSEESTLIHALEFSAGLVVSP